MTKYMTRSIKLALLLIPTLCFGRARTSGYCEQGGQVTVTGGVQSSTKIQQSYPQCTITVYLTGTTNAATIYSDNSGTPLANPFTASKTGLWFYYADNGTYDVKLSGGGIPTPFTWGGISVIDPSTVPPLVNVYPQYCKTPGTNDTSCIQNAISASTGRTVYFNLPPSGAYVTDPIVAPSNVSYLFDPGVSIKAHAGGYPSLSAIFELINVSNITFAGNGATLDFTGSGYTTGQIRPCLLLESASNVTIENLNAKACAGDGLEISYSVGNAAGGSNITARNFNSTNCTRDGFSIVAGTNVLIDGGMHTGAQQAGFDIEPDTDSQVLHGIRVNNVNTVNSPNGAGANVTLGEYTSASTTDIIIKNHTDSGSVLGFVFNSSGGQNGSLIVEDETSTLPAQNCQRVLDQVSPTFSIQLIRTVCINPNTSAQSSSLYGADIAIGRDSNGTGAGSVGYNVSVISPTFIETRGTPHTIRTIFGGDLKLSNLQPITVVNPQASMGVSSPRPWIQSSGSVTDAAGVWTQNVTTSGTSLAPASWPVLVTDTGCNANPCSIVLPAASLTSPVTFQETNGYTILLAGSSAEAILPYQTSEGTRVPPYTSMTIARTAANNGWQVTSGPNLANLTVTASANSGANPQTSFKNAAGVTQTLINALGLLRISPTITQPTCGAADALPSTVQPGTLWFDVAPGGHIFQICTNTAGVYAWVTH